MVADAFADPAVRRVIAHTLPEPNASNHILEKRGSRFDGDVLERGRRSRWAPVAVDLARATAEPRSTPSTAGVRATAPRTLRQHAAPAIGPPRRSPLCGGSTAGAGRADR